MPAWLRHSHAPGWEGVAAAAAPGRKKRLGRTRSEPRWKLGFITAVEEYDFNNQDQREGYYGDWKILDLSGKEGAGVLPKP